MNWVLLSLLAAFIWAFVNIIDKFVVSKLVKQPLIPAIISAVLGLFATGAIFVIRGFEPLSALHIFIGIVGGCFYGLMIYFYFKAVSLQDISNAIALMYLAPLYILILSAIFLGEMFTPIKYFGIFLLVCGAVLISFKRPVRISFDKGFWFMICAGVCVAFYSILKKYLLGYADYWTVFSWQRIGAFLIFIPTAIIYIPRLLKVKKKNLKPIAFMSFAEVLNLTAVFIETVAVAIGSVTLVNALGSFQPLFVLLLAILVSIFMPKILKEELDRKVLSIKLLAVVMIIVGGILIT
ncbi:DMT family transporter [Candidatus Woesearchaeota archaeon]|nr:DMT family transporter [Candidatus Woesearchaeota archaeon]